MEGKRGEREKKHFSVYLKIITWDFIELEHHLSICMKKLFDLKFPFR